MIDQEPMKAAEPKDDSMPKIYIEARAREFLPPTMKVSHDAWITFNEKIAEIIERAAVRCRANNRNTLRPEDF